MADLSNISKDICKKKNLDKNLSLYINNMMSLHNRFSHIKLAMNYYTFCDVVAETEDAVTDEVASYLNDLNVIIKENVVNNSDDTHLTAVEALKAMRAKITGTMEIVTAYVDRFAIFEHILNRVEYKFLDEAFNQDYYETQFVNDIMNYILADRDSVVINGKICEVVGQLPMRLTKSKFFELVKESMGLYKGQEKSALKDFMYMLETVSGIYSPEGFEGRFADLYEILSKLSGYDYKDMDEATFKKAQEELQFASDYITKVSDLYVQLMELVNDTMTILISAPYAFCDSEEKANCIFILNSVMDADNMELSDEIYEDITDKFISFEGKQEKIYSQISSNDYAIDDIASSFTKELEELELCEAFERLKQVSLLGSGSNFVSLDVHKEEGIAEESDVEAIFDVYYEKMSADFKNHSQVYNRAVMAAVLASLPVFFNNVDEIMAYVNTALSQCSDLAERKACVSLIQMMIEDSNV